MEENQNAEKIILEDDPEAAVYRTDISGWVSRTGLYYGEQEGLARTAGATHRECPECGRIRLKNQGCKPCAEKRVQAEWAARPIKKWDETGMIYSMTNDVFFHSIAEAEEYAEDTDTFMADLRLVICEPVYARPIEEDYFENDLPEDCSIRDIDPDLDYLIAAVNEHIKAKKTPLSWMPGKFAVDLSE